MPGHELGPEVLNGGLTGGSEESDAGVQAGITLMDG